MHAHANAHAHTHTSLGSPTETMATTKGQEKRLEVNEMRMLRWMCGVTKKDKIRNEHVRGSVKVSSLGTKSWSFVEVL